MEQSSSSPSPPQTDEMPRGAYYLPHPTYAEDQPYARTILSVHVLYRAFQAGALVGGVAGAIRYAARRGRTTAAKPASLATTLLRGAGRGSLVASALLAVALPLRMRGKAEIEWQDRAWRLMENKGQVSTDRWSGAAAVAAGIGAAATGMAPVAALGAVGVGSLAGCAGSMGYRYSLAKEKSGKA